MAFINKHWQRNMSGNLINAGCRVGGALAGGFLLQKFAPYKANANDTEKTLYNVGGPALLLTSVALDLMADNEYIRSVAQGMTVIAATHSLNVVTPAIAETFTPSVEPPKPAEGTNGVPEQAALMGGCGTVGAISAGEGLPEEFNEVDPSKFQNDGNPWNEVAEKIDDPNTTIKVEGVPSANLMGDEDEAELESKLMGIF